MDNALCSQTRSERDEEISKSKCTCTWNEKFKSDYGLRLTHFSIFRGGKIVYDTEYSISFNWISSLAFIPGNAMRRRTHYRQTLPSDNQIMQKRVGSNAIQCRREGVVLVCRLTLLENFRRRSMCSVCNLEFNEHLKFHRFSPLWWQLLATLCYRRNL